jgi:hypothetical protein
VKFQSLKTPEEKNAELKRLQQIKRDKLKEEARLAKKRGEDRI